MLWGTDLFEDLYEAKAESTSEFLGEYWIDKLVVTVHINKYF